MLPLDGNNIDDNCNSVEDNISTEASCITEEEYKCPLSNVVLTQNNYIRFVVSPENIVYPDIYEKLPDLGDDKQFYLYCEKSNIENFIKYCADKELNIDKDIISNIKNQLLNYSGELLSMANNAGQLTYGFEKVESSFKKKRKGSFITCAKENCSSRVKLENIYRHNNKDKTIDIFNSELLSKSIGRSNPVYVFVEYGGLSRKINVQVNKYHNLCDLV